MERFLPVYITSKRLILITFLCSIISCIAGNSFECSTISPCNNSTLITCNDNESCFVRCTAYESCINKIIYAPNTGNLTIQCDNEKACKFATIYGPTSGHLTVSCDGGNYACYEATIHAPSNGNLILECLHRNVCQRSIINATSMVSGSLDINAIADSSMRWAKVYCPQNNNQCNVYCRGYLACSNSIIYTEEDSILQMIAQGTNALEFTHIYCQSRNDSCSITAIGSNAGILSNLFIHSTRGLQDVSLSCNYTQSMDVCYDAASPPRILCKHDQIISQIYVRSSHADWDHVYGANNTDLCDSYVASGSYGNIHQCSTYSNACKYQSIFCAEGFNCSVICSTSYDCGHSKIYAPSYGNLQLECTGYASCGYVAVHANNTNAGSLSTIFKESSFSHGVIYCAGNSNECNIYCADLCCGGARFYTEPDTMLQVTAEGRMPLNNVNIYCPSSIDGRCSIAVQNGELLLSSVMIFSHNGLEGVSLSCNYTTNPSECYINSNPPLIACSSDYQVLSQIYLNSSHNDWQHAYATINSDLCSDKTPNGFYGKTFFIRCGEYCSDLNLYCVNNEDCDIICISNSCHNLTIHGPETGDLALKCRLSADCTGSIVYAPMFGDLSFECNYAESCDDISFIGPIIGNVSIECLNHGANDICNGITVNASNMISGALSIASQTPNSDIYCPANGNKCNIYCGDSGCMNSTIYTFPDSQLYINATGTKALQSATIYCPQNGCNVNAADGEHMLSNSIWHSENGVQSLNLVCEYISDISECYDIKPRLYYNKTWSKISLQCDTTNIWSFSSGTAVCWSLDPTAAPTYIPTNNPVFEPTTEPTIDRTLLPTIKTFVPSHTTHFSNTESTEKGNDDDDNTKSKTDKSESPLLYIVIIIAIAAGCVVLLIFIGAAVYRIYFSKQLVSTHVNRLNLATVSSNDNDHQQIQKPPIAIPKKDVKPFQQNIVEIQGENGGCEDEVEGHVLVTDDHQFTHHVEGGNDDAVGNTKVEHVTKGFNNLTVNDMMKNDFEIIGEDQQTRGKTDDGP